MVCKSLPSGVNDVRLTAILGGLFVSEKSHVIPWINWYSFLVGKLNAICLQAHPSAHGCLLRSQGSHENGVTSSPCGA